MLVREAMERFERGLVGQGASVNTVATYKRNLERFVEAFDGKEVERITTPDLNEHLFSARLKADGSEKTPRTMNALKTALRSFFKSLGLKEDPAKAIRIKPRTLPHLGSAVFPVPGTTRAMSKGGDQD